MDLEGEQARLEVSNKYAARTFQQFTDHIQEDHKTIEENHYIISRQKREIEKLNLEKARLANNIDSIHHNDETYIRVKEIVKQIIESIIPGPRKLLRLALASLFESSRKHPGKFQVLYYNMSTHLSVEQILSQSFIGQNINQSRYGEGKDEKLLIDEAERCYNRMVNAITNNCVNGMQNKTEPLYHSPQVLHVNDGLSSVADNHEILDTGNLSQVNFVYNNVTFQVYPKAEFTNKQNNETSYLAEENELGRYNFSKE